MRTLRELHGLVEGSAAQALWRHHRERLQHKVSPTAPALTRLSGWILLMVRWIVEYILFSFLPKHPFATYGDGETGIFPLAPVDAAGDSAEAEDGDRDGAVRIALAADWGVGTREAAAVAREIQARAPHYTLHLGDVYWVGSPSEVNEYCLGNVVWPHGSQGSWALNADHEMYGRGIGYYRTFLPTLGPARGGGGSLAGQPTSYLALENRHWRVIVLDTGYNSTGKLFVELFTRPSCRLPEPLLEWLRDTVQLGNPDDRRGIVLLTHHSNRSAFSSDKNIFVPAQQIAEFLGTERPVLWFWGHDHRLALYDLASVRGGVAAYGRCIGNGGMLVEVSETPSDPTSFGLQIYDARLYKELEVGDGAIDLQIGFNGFALLSLRGPSLTAEYFTLGADPAAASQLVLKETWTVDEPTGSVCPPNFNYVDPGLTRVADTETATTAEPTASSSEED